MKRISLSTVYEAGLLIVLFLAVLHAPITVWLGTIFPDQQTGIKAWKELLIAGLAVVAIVLITKRRLWSVVIHNPLILLSLAYIDIYLLLALLIDGEPVSIVAGLMIDLRFIVMFMLCYVLILLRPQALKRMFMAAASGAAVVVGFGLLQITVLPDDILRHIGYSKESTIAPYVTIDSNSDFVRINSTLRGPNPLGALVVIYISLAAAYLLQKYRIIDIRRRIALLVGIGVGAAVVFASYSRSAYGALIVSVGILLVSMGQFTKRTLLLGTVGSILVAGMLLLSSQSDWFSNVILHEDPESTVVSKSNDEHAQSLQVGWQRMLAEPFGHGVGSTGSASLYDNNQANDIIIENYYFFVAHEAGWIGLVLFIALFGCIMYQLWKIKTDWKAKGLFVSGIGLALIGVLLPVWVDETVALIWWGLAGAILATEVRASAKSKA